MDSENPGRKGGLNWPLLALGVGAFGIGTTEFAPMGLLPAMADGVDVSIPTAGTLVTAYAVGVMIGAPVITLLFGRFSKKNALLLLMGIFVIGNLLSAAAPGYLTLLVSRVVTSLSQGAFFGFGAVVATSVVPREKQASAVATMFLGLSIANIGGVPAASWLGQYVSWRAAFGGTAMLGVLAILALQFALPKDHLTTRPDIRGELAALANVDLLIAVGTTVMFAGGIFTIYTYVAPMLETLAGASGDFITMALILIGLGFTVGNWTGGKVADWSLDGATFLFLAGMGTISIIMAFAMGNLATAALSLFLWAAIAFGIVPALQIRAMKEAANAPSLAAAINIAAFNFGNAVGASVGGGVITAGLGYAALPVAAGFMAFGGVGLVWAARRRSQRKLVIQGA
ncbi:MFS transporter [Thalassospira sp.]|uniref:MFS transporter n=1 Tax=Thalassospira sp. TaxID=1912094 RepID=UPI000C645FDC|nr:MFS transporter [Thalassospira sp.]MBC06132.1 MFS transporter [Thalassospira sp.]|tara:strand:- start:23022 stop:24218 length:1197 start_codon:yes stop_codon:yes gene_type:complete